MQRVYLVSGVASLSESGVLTPREEKNKSTVASNSEFDAAPVEVTAAEAEKYLGYKPKAGEVITVPISDIKIPEALKNRKVPDEYFDAENVFPPYYRKETNYEQVIKALDRVLEILPDDPILLGKKGNSLEALQKYEEALAVYEHTLSKYPTFLPNMYNKVFCLERLHKNEACNEYFDLILKHYPYEAKALANKGKILKRLGRLKEGLAYCKKALKLDPKEFSALYNKDEIEEMLKTKGKSGRQSTKDQT